MTQYIKVVNPAVVQYLANCGFTYIKELVNGKTYYCFQETEEVLAAINQNFANEPLLRNSKLHF